MTRRRAAWIALALGTAAVFAACEEPHSKGPERGPRFDELETPVFSPTPIPLRAGEWSVALSGTASLCGLATPPEKAYLQGGGHAWEIAAQQDLVDVSGAWDGTNLALTGSSRRVFRPETDCIVDESETWKLSRVPVGTVATALTGTLTFARNEVEGADCATAVANVSLPCKGTRRATLTFASSRPAPKTEPFVPQPLAPGETPVPRHEPRPAFSPFTLDPQEEPTSAPDLLRGTPTPAPTPAAVTPTPKAKTKKSKSKKR